jgi:glycosyltransferase involved in cell wall biosynthesis
MKGKIGEALSLGVPVVTTTIGAEGMDLVHGETALIRDDPESFAADVARLYTDDGLWIELARNGRCHVAENFGPDALKSRLEKILADVLG